MNLFMKKQKLSKTYQIGMLNEIKFVKYHIHRFRPNFEIGSLIGRNL